MAKLVADTAKTWHKVWNDSAKMFDGKAGVVRRVMCVYDDGSVTILTDEGLAFYPVKPTMTFYRRLIITALTGMPAKSKSAIVLVDESHCIQACAAYDKPDVFVYIVLTDKGMIQYVHQSRKDAKFYMMNTVQLVEGSNSNTVFSAIICRRSLALVLTVVAGFDVDRQVNMLIVLNEDGHRLSKFDAIENDDGMPIVDMFGWHDNKLDVILILSQSIRSVYVHCVNVKHQITQIFDRHMDSLDINGVNVGFSSGKYITLLVYGQRETRGGIVVMRLNLNYHAIIKLN